MFKKIVNIAFFPVLLITLCILSYHHSIAGTFVFDDSVAVVKNQDVINPMNLSNIFSHDFWGANLNDADSHKSYRPLTILMFNFEYNYLNFRSYHMKYVNLVLHCVNSCLLFKVLLNLTPNEIFQVPTALIGTTVFAVHPVHTEAVCGIVGRAELMFCLCFLLSLWITDHIASHNTQSLKVSAFIRLFITTIIAVVGILFKESAITILPVCILYEFVKLQHYRRSLKLQIQYLFQKRNSLFICVTAIILNMRLWIQNFESPKFQIMDNPIAASEDLLTRLLSQNFLYALNFWILFCPQWLCCDWAVGCVQLLTSVTDFRLLGVLLMYMYLYMVAMTKDSIHIMGTIFLIIPFLPASGMVKVGFVIAERILYVPSIGVCLIFAYSYNSLLEKSSNKVKIFLYVSWIFLLACFILRTRQRAVEWMTEEKLFTSALLVCPQNAKIHYNIARLSTDKNNVRKALEHYHKAITLYPEYEAALMNLGNVYRELGDLVKAEMYLKNAIEVKQQFPTAWMNLGIVQAAQKKFSEALRSYRKALRYKKRYPICYYNMGNLFLEMRQFSEAIKHWQECVAMDPFQSKAWANLLTMLDNRGLFEDVIRLSNQALKYLPQETAIMFIRANVFGKVKQYIEAEELYKRVIVAEPLNPMYHTNLGVLYHRWGKINYAIDSYKTAMKLNPKTAQTATQNLNKLIKSNRITLT